MDKVTIKQSYRVQYHDPITLKAGEMVKLGEQEQEEKWKGWIMAETSTHRGWIPMHAVDLNTGEMLEDYSAGEVDVNEGEQVQKLRSLHGWSWVRRLRDGAEGWIPDEVMK